MNDLTHQADDAGKQQRHRRIAFQCFFLVILMATLILLGFYWFSWRHVQTTDDAVIDAPVAAVSAQLSGRVQHIPVRDNQWVTAGQLLVQLDGREQQHALDKALASLRTTEAKSEQIQAQIDALMATLQQGQADITLAEAEFERDHREYQRWLHSGIAVTQNEVDRKLAASKTSAARLDARRHSITHTKALLAKEQAALRENSAVLLHNKIVVDNARLQLSWTQIIAPMDGYVTKRTTEQGNYVAPGHTLLYIVSDRIWVTGRFKEVQLRHMHPGQPVEVRVDAWPRERFSAQIDSLQRATGSVFSLFPAENASGNYVKVVQRLPVRIEFTDARIRDFPLVPGMSVVLRVDVRN